jgi:hypothetical protein
MTITATKSRRRWFQFSLKALMVLVVVAAIPCGWLKWKMVCKERERAAAEEIENLGGLVMYGREKEPPGAAWLRKLLGDDFFSTVHFVRLDGNKIADESLVNLEQFADLETLQLPCQPVSDDIHIHLMGLTHLKLLDLQGTAVTDDGLGNLKRLKGLAYLDLTKTSVTDAGVADLQKALPHCLIVR